MSDSLKTKLAPFVVTKGKDFKLKDHPTTRKNWKLSKKETRKRLDQGVELLRDHQEKLYAQDTKGLLLIFQAMDAAGKDGAIKHVMSGINPQGCQVYSFKSPSPEELDHDFLWRTTKALPERGRIGIFNRSYYEEVLVVRVHPEFLQKQKLPPEVLSKDIWKERFEDINAVERYLTRNGYTIRKFFLHVSKKEQKRRFLERLDMEQKNWKFSLADARERGFWDKYMEAYRGHDPAHGHAARAVDRGAGRRQAAGAPHRRRLGGGRDGRHEPRVPEDLSGPEEGPRGRQEGARVREEREVAVTFSRRCSAARR